MPGIFARPRRSVLPTLSQGQSEFPVRADAELRSAIRTIAARGSSGDGGAFGCRITIVAPIKPAAPYVIPPQCGGMQITAAGFVPIIPSGVLSSLFTLRARAVQLIGLLVEAPSTTQCASVFALTDTSSAQHLIVERCIVNADKFIVDTGGKLNGSHFSHNLVAAVSTAAVPTVESGATNCRYDGNTHTSAHASKAVLLDATGGTWSIVGNALNSRGIDTSAGGVGNNTIVGNVLAGAIASAGSDAVGLNT